MSDGTCRLYNGVNVTLLAAGQEVWQIVDSQSDHNQQVYLCCLKSLVTPGISSYYTYSTCRLYNGVNVTLLVAGQNVWQIVDSYK